MNTTDEMISESILTCGEYAAYAALAVMAVAYIWMGVWWVSEEHGDRIRALGLPWAVAFALILALAPLWLISFFVVGLGEIVGHPLSALADARRDYAESRQRVLAARGRAKTQGGALSHANTDGGELSEVE